MLLFRKKRPPTTIDLGDCTAEVVFTAVKNLNLRIRPSDGAVRISAPWYVSLEDVRAFAVSKREWIEQQRQRIRELQPEPVLQYADGETVLLWGTEHHLRVEEVSKTASVTVEPDAVVLRLRPGTSTERRHQLVDAWYRDQLMAELPALFSRWEPEMGVRSRRVAVQKMKTRWGTCQPSTGTIRLNSELAKKPRECLTYVLVHELAHLIEASHGPRFVAVMDKHLPQWPRIRKLLNGKSSD